MRLINFLLVVFIFTGIVFAQSTKEEREVYRAAVDDSGIQKIKVLGGGYFYNPNYIIVRNNIPVEIIIKKESGLVPHNIVINKPEAGMNIKEPLSSQQKVIKFTPVQTGKYPFYCDKKLLFFKNHREKGMEGIIEVIE